MTVTELIELLEECDPDATVRIMNQESWPFENAVRGIAVRDDFAESSCDCETDRAEHGDGCPASGNYADGLEGTDVFIIEGAQERYGDKAAWEAVRRSAREVAVASASRSRNCSRAVASARSRSSPMLPSIAAAVG